MAENLEFMGAFSLYERGLGPVRDALAWRRWRTASSRASASRRTPTAACSGWPATATPQLLRLAAVRGLVRPDEEPEELSAGVAAARAGAGSPSRGATPSCAHAAGRLGDEDKTRPGPHGAALGRAATRRPAARRGALTDRLDGGELR